MNEKCLVWIDLETTGLDPEKGRILEVGAIITDIELTVLGQYHAVLAHELASVEVDPFVVDMHTKNGLWEECKNSHETCFSADAELSSFIDDMGATDAPLAGATVHFDRSWMRLYMPCTFDSLHYRSVDVSNLKVLWRMLGRSLPPRPENAEAAHRSIADLEASIADLKFFIDDARLRLPS